MIDGSSKEKIRESKLIGKRNEVLMAKADIIEKGTSRGLLIIFTLKISEVEG